MYKKLAALFLSLFVIVSAHADTASDPVNLKWQFKKGDTFVLNGNFHATANANIPKQMLAPPAPPAGLQQQVASVPPVTGSEKAIGDFVLELQWNVAVTNVDLLGNADLQMTLQKMHVKADGKLADEKFNYDADLMQTAVPGADGKPQPLISKEDAVHVWRVAPTGQIIAINGHDVKQTIMQFNKQLNDAGVKADEKEIQNLANMFVYFMAVYPDSPVKVGQNWARQADLSNLIGDNNPNDNILVSNFQLLLKQDWTVKNKQGSEVTLEEKSDSMPKFAMAIEGPEANVKIQFTGKEQSQVKLDDVAGLARSTSQKLNLTGSVMAQEKKGSNQQLEIPFELNIQTDFSLTK